MDSKQIDNLFTYRKPFGTQPQRYEEIRFAARAFAHVLNAHCPESREKSIAITQLQLAVMAANSSIALNESEQDYKDQLEEKALQAEAAKGEDDRG